MKFRSACRADAPLVLYHAVSSYQLLEVMLHRLQFHSRDRAVLLLPDFITRKYPQYRHDTEKNILFSYCIQGAYHAYLNNPEADTQTLVETIGRITQLLRPMVREE